jgi:hypothetical protein
MAYDIDPRELAFVKTHSGVSRDQAAMVLRALAALHNVMGGVHPPDPDVDVTALRAKYPDLLRPAKTDAGFLSHLLEATFAQLETGLPVATVVRVLVAMNEYMAKQGWIDREDLEAYRAWATEWIEGER